MEVVCYVDGFNLYYGALKGTPYKWLDLGALCDAIVPLDQVTKIVYFTAPIKPTIEDSTNQANRRQQIYWRALRLDSRIEIVQGVFKTAARWQPFVDQAWSTVTRPRIRPTNYVDGVEDRFAGRLTRVPKAYVLKTEEKSSDVNLGAHLLRDTYIGNLKKAVVITNDSDLKTPIGFARDHGVTVGLISPAASINRELRIQASFVQSIHGSMLKKYQFEDELVSPTGSRISKPNVWKQETQKPASREAGFRPER